MKRKSYGWKSFFAAVIAVALSIIAPGWAHAGALPSGYTRLLYIESDGNQWIDTGVKQAANTVAEIELMFPSLPVPGTDGSCIPRYSYFGATSSPVSTTDDTFTGQIIAFKDPWVDGVYWGRVFKDVAHLGKWFDLPTIKAGTDYSVVLRNGGVCTVDGQTLEEGTATAGDLNYYLFAMNNSGAVPTGECWGAGANVRIYSCKISYGNEVQRDFVPCQDPNGKIGMYDMKNEEFYENKGSGGFQAGPEDKGGEMFRYIESDGNQWIDTGVKQAANTVAEIELMFPSLPVPGTDYGSVPRYSYFGARSAISDADDTFDGQIIALNDGVVNGVYWGRVFKGIDFVGKWFDLPTITAGTDYSVVLRNGGVCTVDGQTLEEGTATAAGLNYYLFALNENGRVQTDWTWGAGANVRIYSCKISYGNAVQRDFVPFRQRDGQIGMFDRKTRTFYPNQGTGAFKAGGLVFYADGTIIDIYRGDLAPQDVVGYSEVRKTTSGAVTAGHVTDYPGDLTLACGEISLLDGTAKTVTVADTLTLAGGTTLRVDVTADGCDSFVVGSLDLSGVTTGNPVNLEVKARYDESCNRGWMTLVKCPSSSAAALTGSVDKFVLSGTPAFLRVVDGELQMKLRSAFLPDGYVELPYIESDGNQWIDTGVKQAANTVAEIELMFPSLPVPGTDYAWVPRYSYFGARSATMDAEDTFDGQIIALNDGTVNGVYWGRVFKGIDFVGKWFDLPTIKAGTDYSVVLRNGGVCTVDGQTLEEGTATAAGLNYYLFALNENGSVQADWTWGACANVRIYSCKISYGDVVQRYFVPCQDPSGKLGMYDIANEYQTAAEGFYGNQGTSGDFHCECIGRRVSYIESDGNQWIDTGVKQAANTVAEIELMFPSLPEPGDYISDPSSARRYSYFGARSAMWNADDTFDGQIIALKDQWVNGVSWGCVFKGLDFVGQWLDLPTIKAGTDYSVVLRNGGVCTVDGQTLKEGTATAGDLNYYLFALNENGSVGTDLTNGAGANVRIYSCKISYGNEVQRDFVPFCRWDGVNGMLDLVERKFYPNQGTGAFSHLKCEPDGTTLKVREGTLLDSDIAAYDAVEKVDSGSALLVSGATALKNLTVSEGEVTQAGDGELTQVPLTGTLTLKGGTTLGVDITAEGCDSFAPTAVNLAGASEANPVCIAVTLAEGFEIGKGDKYTLISSGLQPGDEKKFRLDISQEKRNRLLFTVVDGALKLLHMQGMIIMVR